MDGPWQQLSYFPPPNSHEAAVFANLWQVASADSNGSLQGAKAVDFLKKSKLEMVTLKKIWSLSTQQATMIRDQFYVALRFIALAQNGATDLSQNMFLMTSRSQLGPPMFDIPFPTANRTPGTVPALSPRSEALNGFSTPRLWGDEQTPQRQPLDISDRVNSGPALPSPKTRMPPPPPGSTFATASTTISSVSSVGPDGLQKTLTKTKSAYSTIGPDSSWGPPDTFPSAQPTQTPRASAVNRSGRDYVSPEPSQQVTPGHAVDVKRVVWIGDGSNVDDEAPAASSSSMSSYQQIRQQQTSHLQYPLQPVQQRPQHVSPYPPQSQFQQQRQSSHEFDRRAQQIARERQDIASEISQLEASSMMSLQHVDDINEEVRQLRDQLEFLLLEQEKVRSNELTFRSVEEQLKYLAELEQAISKTDSELQVRNRSLSVSPAIEPTIQMAPEDFTQRGMMYLSGSSSKSVAAGSSEARVNATNSLALSASTAYDDEIQQKIQETEKFSKVEAIIVELRRLDVDTVNNRIQLDAAIKQQQFTINMFEQKKNELRVQKLKYDPSQCVVSARIKDLHDEKMNMEGVLLVMYEELEGQEIRLFTLRKELLLASAADYREYEQRRDKSTDDLDIKNRLAMICALSVQSGSLPSNNSQDNNGWASWDSRGSALSPGDRFRVPSPRSKQHESMERELQMLRAELENAQAGQVGSRQRFFQENSHSRAQQQLNEAQAQISAVSAETLEMEAKAFAASSSASLARLQAQSSSSSNTTSSSFEITEARSVSSSGLSATSSSGHSHSHSAVRRVSGTSAVYSPSLEITDRVGSADQAEQRTRATAQFAQQKLEMQSEDNELLRKRLEADVEAEDAVALAKLEFDRLEQLKAARAAAKEKKEAERKAAEEAELKRQAQARAETERRAMEMAAAAKAKADKEAALLALAEARAEADQIAEEMEREAAEAAAEEAERQRLVAQRIEAERKAAEAAAAILIENERLDRVKQLREQAARDAEARRLEAKDAEERRLAAMRAEADRYAAEFEAIAKADMARKAAEIRAQELKAEAERLELQRLEDVKREAERAAAKRAEEAQLEAERQALLRAEEQRREAERIAAVKAEEVRREAERVAALKAEQQRLEAERLAEEARLEAERIAARRAEEARREQEWKAEEARREAERAALLKAEEEKFEAERQALIRAEEAKIAALRKAEEERRENERRAEEAQREAERLAALRAEEARREAERLAAVRAEELRREQEKRAEEHRLEQARIAEEQRLERLQKEKEAAAEKQRLQDIADADMRAKAHRVTLVDRFRGEDARRKEVLYAFAIQKRTLLAEVSQLEQQSAAEMVQYRNDVNDLEALQLRIADLQQKMEAAVANKTNAMELTAILAEAEGIAAEISHYETQGAEMSELDIQSRKELEKLTAEATAIRQNPLDIALGVAEKEISSLYEILGAMRIILLSYSDEGEAIEPPQLNAKKNEELMVLKTANTMLENYKVQIMSKIREAKTEKPRTLSTSSRKASISADPRSPLHSVDRQISAFSPRASATANAGAGAGAGPSTGDDASPRFFDGNEAGGPLSVSSQSSEGRNSFKNSPVERNFNPRLAVQKEKESKPMSELEKKFASRKSKSGSSDSENN